MIAPTASEEIDYALLHAALAAAKNDSELFQTIVNAPMQQFKVETAFLFLGIMVLLLVNKETGNIDRIALSNNELAEATKEVSAKRFEDIKIPVDYHKNIIAAAIASGEPQDTTDWRFLFEPGMTAAQARVNQANAGIAYSAVYPLVGVRDGAAMIFSYFQYPEHIGDAQKRFMQQYTSLVAEQLKQPS